MKTVEIVGVIAGFCVFVQFLKWVLDSLGIGNILGDTLTFLLSALFALILVVIIILIQQDKDIKRIKGFLKKKGFREKERVRAKMVKKRRNKRGMIAIDPKILFWIILIILVYLFLKSLGLF